MHGNSQVFDSITQVYVDYEEINYFVYEDATCTSKTIYKQSESDQN